MTTYEGARIRWVRWIAIFYKYGEQSFDSFPKYSWHIIRQSHTPIAACCTVKNSFSFCMGEILTVVINVFLCCGGRVNLSHGNSQCVLLPLRMRSGRSGWALVFVLALAFSTYPVLGILKKTCPVPSSVHCFHCVLLPSLGKVKTKPAQTLHC